MRPPVEDDVFSETEIKKRRDEVAITVTFCGDDVLR